MQIKNAYLMIVLLVAASLTAAAMRAPVYPYWITRARHSGVMLIDPSIPDYLTYNAAKLDDVWQYVVVSPKAVSVSATAVYRLANGLRIAGAWIGDVFDLNWNPNGAPQPVHEEIKTIDSVPVRVATIRILPSAGWTVVIRDGKFTPATLDVPEMYFSSLADIAQAATVLTQAADLAVSYDKSGK